MWNGRDKFMLRAFWVAPFCLCSELLSLKLVSWRAVSLPLLLVVVATVAICGVVLVPIALASVIPPALVFATHAGTRTRVRCARLAAIFAVAVTIVTIPSVAFGARCVRRGACSRRILLHLLATLLVGPLPRLSAVAEAWFTAGT